MYGIEEYLKLIIINTIILIVFLFLPSLALYSYRKFIYINDQKITKEMKDKFKVDYPVYEDKDKAMRIYEEAEQRKTIYKYFIGWRRLPIKLKYWKISGKYSTRYSSGEKLNNSNWFFGGSTMMGYGVSNIETIPSIFNQKTNQNVFNFGEGSWNSRQSLNQLINLIGDGINPSVVVFYDGVNDV